MSSGNKIVNSFIWKLLERFSSQAISIVVTIILARLLLPSEFGVVVIVTVFIEIANVIVDGGLNTALIQKRGADNKDFSTIFYFNLLVAAVMYAVIFFAAPLIAAFYGNTLLVPILRVLSVNLFLNSFNAIQRAYVAKNMLFDRLFLCNSVAVIASGGISIYMVYVGYGLWSLIGQQISYQLVLTLTMWYSVKWRPQCVFSMQRLRGLLDYGWKIFVTNIIISIYENIRGLIIGKMYKPSELAYFDRGRQLPNLVMSNICVSLQAILLPAFSDIQDDRAHVKKLMRQSVKIVNSIILPILVLLAASAKPLVRLLLTDKWLEAVPFIQIFCIAFMMMPIQSSNMSALKALGYSGIILKMEMIKKVIETVILVVSFIIGIYAVAWGIVLYNLLCIAINLYPCKSLLNYGMREQLYDIMPYILISVIAGGVSYALMLLECEPGVTLTLQVLVGGIVYVVMNALFNTWSYGYVKDFIGQNIGKYKHRVI